MDREPCMQGIHHITLVASSAPRTARFCAESPTYYFEQKSVMIS